MNFIKYNYSKGNLIWILSLEIEAHNTSSPLSQNPL